MIFETRVTRPTELNRWYALISWAFKQEEDTLAKWQPSLLRNSPLTLCWLMSQAWDYSSPTKWEHQHQTRYQWHVQWSRCTRSLVSVSTVTQSQTTESCREKMFPATQAPPPSGEGWCTTCRCWPPCPPTSQTRPSSPASWRYLGRSTPWSRRPCSLVIMMLRERDESPRRSLSREIHFLLSSQLWHCVWSTLSCDRIQFSVFIHKQRSNFAEANEKNSIIRTGKWWNDISSHSLKLKILK